MTVYKNCLMTVFDADGIWEEECEVNISEEKIVLSYLHEEIRSHINYVGEALGDNHYQMKCPKVKGEATLHRFQNGKILEGYWVEEGYEGMWRIKLKD